MGGKNCNDIRIFKPELDTFLHQDSIYLNSSVHYKTQAFVIDTKSTNPKNILKYYSNNKI